MVIADVELKKTCCYLLKLRLGIPTILVINMADQMKRNISLDIPILEQTLETKIALVSTRENTGLEELKN